MSRLGVICAIVLIFLPCITFAAEPQISQQLCHEDNLIGGTWKMVDFKETPPSNEAGWVRDIPYHYLAFYQEHYYGFVATDHEMQTPAQLQTALSWPQKGNRRLKYTLDASGVLNLYIDKNINYSYRCVAITKTAGGYQKNDLILTGYAKDGKSTFYKLYRRWF